MIASKLLGCTLIAFITRVLDSWCSHSVLGFILSQSLTDRFVFFLTASLVAFVLRVMLYGELGGLLGYTRKRVDKEFVARTLTGMVCQPGY